MTKQDAMFSLLINPRFCDTDAMGHINNTVVPVWFLEGRESILRIFNPNLSTEEVSLVLAKIEIEYLEETFFGKPVEIRTYVLRIGTSSVLVGRIRRSLSLSARRPAAGARRSGCVGRACTACTPASPTRTVRTRPKSAGRVPP